MRIEQNQKMDANVVVTGNARQDNVAAALHASTKHFSLSSRYISSRLSRMQQFLPTAFRRQAFASFPAARITT